MATRARWATRRTRRWPTSSWSTWWRRQLRARRRRRRRWTARRPARNATTRCDCYPRVGGGPIFGAQATQQPALPRAALHAARGSAVAVIPHLSARPGHVARIHRRQGRARWALGRDRKLPVPRRRRGGEAVALQHALLHDRRERHQVLA